MARRVVLRMTEEKPKEADWVLEQLEKISMHFEDSEEPERAAISELAYVLGRVIQHINVLYNVLGNIVDDPIKKDGEELEYFT